MTNDQINAAIAEACGWTRIHVEDFSEGGVPCFMTMGLPPGLIHIENSLILPDYCNDLNAMHEAEKVLTKINWFTYISELAQIVRLPKQPEVQIKQSIHATARQRAEAFLRTLGKWEEVQA